jgi:hypothetical protein
MVMSDMDDFSFKLGSHTRMMLGPMSLVLLLSGVEGSVHTTSR